MLRRLAVLFAIATSVFLYTPVLHAATTANDSISQACKPVPGMTQAQIDALASNPACTATDDDPVTGKDGIVMTVANLLAWFAGAVAVIMIIFAGFRMVKSSGDPQKITQARETIIYALVGLVVIALSRFIIGLVISKL